MPRILLLVTALIIYGSLYPWQFHASHIAASPLWILLHSWPAHYDRFNTIKDIPINVAMYVPFGTAAFLAFRRRPLWLRYLLPIACAVVLSASMEMIQIYDAKRICSLLDFVTNVIGCALGVAGGAVIERMGVHLPSLEANGPAELYLLLAWAAARTFPLMPDLSRTRLYAKWAVVRASSLQPVPAVLSAMEWLVVFRLLAGVLGPERSRRLGPWLWLLVPARFFIAELVPTWDDALGALCGWLLWSGWLARRRRRDLILAAALLGAIVLRGLTPFDFTVRAQHFYWVPFTALFQTLWQTGFAVMLHKLFLYGSAIWLCLAAGVPAVVAGAGAVFVLSALEAAQVYLPAHIAESTDPLLAVMLAWILNEVRKKHAPPALNAVRKRRVKRRRYDPASPAIAPDTDPPKTSDS